MAWHEGLLESNLHADHPHSSPLLTGCPGSPLAYSSPAVPATHARRKRMRTGRTGGRAAGSLIAALGSLVAIVVPSATRATSVQAAVPAPYVQQGYWIVTTDGSVFNYGTAINFGGGSAPGKAVWLTPTPTGLGYWIPTFGGVVHAFGDAPFLGDAAQVRLNAGIKSMASIAQTGYWLVGGDGGIFNYGTAGFFGSTGS